MKRTVFKAMFLLRQLMYLQQRFKKIDIKLVYFGIVVFRRSNYMQYF